MTTRSKLLGLFVASALISPLALADGDVTGKIEKLDQDNKTIEVQGITLHATDKTRFDDGLDSFDDLKEGQRVEVDFEYKDGRHVAKEIEKDN